jgi:hypothetical protein
VKIRFKEMQGRMASDGKPSTQEEIAQILGVGRGTIAAIVAGHIVNIPGVYIDAFCQISGMTVGELIDTEPVTLPLPSKRPDRRGKPFGAKTKEE